MKNNLERLNKYNTITINMVTWVFWMFCLTGDFNEKQNVMDRKQLTLCGLLHLTVCSFLIAGSASVPLVMLAVPCTVVVHEVRVDLLKFGYALPSAAEVSQIACIGQLGHRSKCTETVIYITYESL